jgi:hypothetical protein
VLEVLAPTGVGAATRFEGATVDGAPAIAWEGQAGQTLFLGAVFDCPKARVMVVTSGRAADLRDRHAAAVAGATCARRTAGA